MICVPIVSDTMKQALADMEQARPLADLLELRIDLIGDFDLPRLLQSAGMPCIVTNRSKKEGGQFKGSEEERVACLQQAVDLGVDYIDIETSTPGPLLKPVLESKGKTRTILSHHDFMRTPDTLGPLYELMCELPADILKIVTYARDINDNLILFDLLKRAQKDNRKLIALCMGEKGEISRILSPLQGGFLTFGSLQRGKESAPGQIPASTLKHVYRVDRERVDGKIYGVIGNPVSKSMGYLIHNRAFAETGLPHIYVPFWVENLEKFFTAFQPRFAGLSVTMPFKEEVMRLLHRVDPTAQKIGAVNTVVREADGWVGYNTDCGGAMRALEAQCSLKDKKVLIVGAGGTAKAIGHGVVERGGSLTVTYNRNKEQGERLAADLGCRLISIRDADQIEIDVLINCSPVGMNPEVNDTPFPARLLGKGMIVFDCVYNPIETRLIKEARSAGCTVISGVDLFINQAGEQFELWTGKTAPAASMREIVVKHLAGS